MNALNSKNLILSITFALILFLVLTWLLSLRPVRIKIGDYYFNQGKFEHAVNWYEKVLRKERFKIAHEGTNLVNYERDLMKFKFSLESLTDEKLAMIGKLLDPEKIKDVNIKSAMRNLLMYLDFSEVFRKGDENYAVAWTALKYSMKPYSNEEAKTLGSYLIGLNKERAKITGVSRLVDGPWEGSKALMIEGIVNFTRVFGPPSALNLKEGTLAVWGRLQDPKKVYSDLLRVNNSNDMYIFRRGKDGRFIVFYNNVQLGATESIIIDDQWHHYVFTWKDGEQKFYIDGKEKLSGNLPASDAFTSLFAIGWLGNGDTEQWHGPFAQLITFDRALAGYEVVTFYHMKEFLAQ